MKKYIALSFLVLAGFFTSCDKDVKGPLYDEDKITGTTGMAVPQGVTFQASSFNHDMAAEDDGKIFVPIIRNNTSVSSVNVAFYNTYPIDKNNKGEDITERRMETTFEAPDGNVFTLETPTVTFAEGELTAYAIVSYESVEDLDPTAAYSTSLVIANGSLALEGVNEVSFVVSRKLTFESIGEGLFSGPFGNFYNKDTLAKYPSGFIPAVIEKAQEGNIFRIRNPFGLLNSDNSGEDLVFIIQPETTDEGFHKVTYTTYSTGYDAEGDGSFIVYSHFVKNAHSNYCYFVPTGQMDDLHKYESQKNNNVIGLYGRFMNKEGKSGFKPNTATIPDDWAWEYSIVLPDDYIYSE